MTRFTLPLFASLFVILTGCLSGKVDMAFQPNEKITGQFTLTIEQSAYGMLAGLQGEDAQPFCGDMAVTFKKDVVVCSSEIATTLDEAIDRVKDAKEDDAEPNANAVSLEKMVIERVDQDKIRISFPLEFKETASLEEPEGMEGVEDMMVASFAGKTIDIHFTGAEVIETNGQVENEGTRASFYIPMVEVIKPSGSLPEAFTALIRYK